jgi:glyoxalase family protein
MGADVPGRPTLAGLHHVTAITGRAADNVAFYTRVLGLRLVKKTVNQDDITAYHLFYGDEAGGPGTEVTFFHWPDAPRRVPGPGTVACISLAVPDAAAVDWWRRRLADLGVEHGEVAERRGRAVLPFADPEGQHLELVEAGPEAERMGRPWAGSPVPTEVAIRGLYGVTLELAATSRSAQWWAALLGFREVDAYADPDGTAVTVLACGPGGPGAEVRLLARPGARPGRPGIGGVHHIAFRAPDDAAQRCWLARLQLARVPTSGIIDRYYFRSLYFHEPGGVLLEIATDGPGFAVDEPQDRLGERLSLPPFLEPLRARIEAALPPLPSPAVLGG